MFFCAVIVEIYTTVNQWKVRFYSYQGRSLGILIWTWGEGGWSKRGGTMHFGPKIVPDSSFALWCQNRRNKVHLTPKIFPKCTLTPNFAKVHANSRWKCIYPQIFFFQQKFSPNQSALSASNALWPQISLVSMQISDESALAIFAPPRPKVHEVAPMHFDPKFR